MVRLCMSVLVVFALWSAAPVPAYAALTEGQIDSILLVLESFGAEESVIREVEIALRGDSYNCTFTHTLYRGVRDETTAGEVSRVQSFLSVEPVSGYYGPITEGAVQVFQAARGVVSSGTPETTGFGVVGPKTRAKLKEVCETQNTETSAGTSSGSTQQGSSSTNQGTGAGSESDTAQTSGQSSTGAGSSATNGSTSTGSNSGSSGTNAGVSTSEGNTLAQEAYRNELRQEVYTVGLVQGVSPNDLAEIDLFLASLPTLEVASSTIVSTSSSSTTTATTSSSSNTSAGTGNTSTSNSGLSTALSSILSSLLQSVFSSALSNALSGTTLRDFGTPRVISVLPCPCSGNVLITMQPTGPDYVTALTYTPGTQAYQSYNIPTIGQSLLGKYTPVGLCMVPNSFGCSPVPNNGNITSFVGSSVQ